MGTHRGKNHVSHGDSGGEKSGVARSAYNSILGFWPPYGRCAELWQSQQITPTSDHKQGGSSC
jgi:hypothetical protein